MEIKNFSIFKNSKKEKDIQPDYRLSAKIGDKYEEIGAGWVKTTQASVKNPDGMKYISVKLKDNCVLSVNETQQVIPVKEDIL